MKSNFKKVIDFNNSFGLTVHDSLQKNILSDDKKLTKLRLDLINEEVNELNDAIKNNDFVETIDALADILYVVYGAGASFGIDLDKAFDVVHKSNMSKLCISEKEAIETVEWYKKNSTIYDTPSYRNSKDNKFWVVYNKSTGKILKSINYTPAKFDSICLGDHHIDPNGAAWCH